MSFDGVFTHAMVNELNNIIVGGRISKIQQPFKNELVLIIRNNRTNYPLLLSANPMYSRIQVTNSDFSNPDVPSNFVMSLRKNIDGAIISKIEQFDNDRTVLFDLETKDDLGYPLNFKLIVEIMGRHSNVILVNSQNNIIDLIKHVSSAKNRFRTMLPGENYISPPATNKKNPFNDFSDTELTDIQTNFEGLGKETTVEINQRMDQADIKRVAFKEFFKEIDNKLTPTITTTADGTVHFSPIEYISLEGKKEYFDTLSEMLDSFYRNRAQNDRMKSHGENLLGVVNNFIKRDKRKIKNLNKDLDKTKDMQKYRLFGELLTANMHLIKPGMKKITVNNYYTNEDIEIKLDPKLSASANSQKYYKTYQKLKNSISHIDEQLTEANNEIKYLESVLYQISDSKLDNLNEIKDELIEQGYISKKQKNKKRHNSKDIGNKFLSSNNILITVGRNNIQNDQLTLKVAKKNFIWLHVKNIPGSHVIISDSTPDDQTLLEAAQLAAFYSKAKNSSNVPVDYVPVKQIKKPNGAKPGFVIYEGQRTINVTPEYDTIEQLKQNYSKSKV